MKVEIQCYGAVREVVGQDRLVRSVEQGTTIANLVDDLLAEWPALSGRGDAGQLVVMYDGRHVGQQERRQEELDDGNTLALSGRAMPE